MIELPSTNYLRECFVYNKETGLLTWKFRARNCFKNTRCYHYFVDNVQGTRAGFYSKNLCIVSISDKKYQVARIIWKLVTGEDPGQNRIVFLDGNNQNFKWDNLELTDLSKSTAFRKTKNLSSTGFRGVSKSRNKFMSRININRKTIYLGRYDTPEEAHERYKKEAIKRFGKFACFN